MKVVASVSERLAKIMKVRELSQKEVADLVGISESLMSKYMHNQNVPMQAILKMSAKLGINPMWLCGYDVAAVTDDYFEKLQRIKELDTLDQFILMRMIDLMLDDKKKKNTSN